MDSSESAGPMKVLGDPMVHKTLLTPRAGILEQQGPDRDLVVNGRNTTSSGFVDSRAMVKDRQNVGTITRVLSDTFNDHILRMFLNKRYTQASVAFLRAGRKREAVICDAYLLREKARSTSTLANAARTQAFVAAADAFIACAQECPSKQDKERLAYYGTAGECYSEARKLKKAGDSYRMAEQYAAAARTYREGEFFDELAEVITQHGNALDNGLLERLRKVTQMYYFKVYSNKLLIVQCRSDQSTLTQRLNFK